jgi:hypothetical protein
VDLHLFDVVEQRVQARSADDGELGGMLGRHRSDATRRAAPRWL